MWLNTKRGALNFRMRTLREACSVPPLRTSRCCNGVFSSAPLPTFLYSVSTLRALESRHYDTSHTLTRRGVVNRNRFTENSRHEASHVCSLRSAARVVCGTGADASFGP